MHFLILMGSPRKNGNTASAAALFLDALLQAGHTGEILNLYDKDLKPCLGCRKCQTDWSGFSCIQQDDMADIFEKSLRCDCILLATPIYSWYCTSPMKAVLDRLAYGMNKYYGDTKGPSLWEGKSLAALITCGYPPEKGADLFKEGIKRYCKHSKLSYKGMLALRHLGYNTVFMNKEKEGQVRAFTRLLL